MAQENAHGLTHIDGEGRARMVDVGGKATTRREATATARLRMAPATARAIAHADGPKGDVIGPARLAGVMAAKRTWDLIPLAHPLPLSYVDVAIAVDAQAGIVDVTAETRTDAPTGVEMEAMTACSIAALTIYDMVKGVERGVVIEQIRLRRKTGGKADWRAGDAG